MPGRSLRIVEAWPIDYNTLRPHGRMGRLPPAVFGTRRRPEEQRGEARSPGRAQRPLASPSERAAERTQAVDVWETGCTSLGVQSTHTHFQSARAQHSKTLRLHFILSRCCWFLRDSLKILVATSSGARPQTRSCARLNTDSLMSRASFIEGIDAILSARSIVFAAMKTVLGDRVAYIIDGP